jgi:hypothetical protein
VGQNVVFIFFGLRLNDTAEVGAAAAQRFHSKIRAELAAPVEKSGERGSRTNVVLAP